MQKDKKTVIRKIRRFTWLRMCLVVAVLICGSYVGYRQMEPPSAPNRSNPHYQSYQQMLANIQAISKAPHVPGSENLEVVRSYIISQIQGMGLKPTVESTTFTSAQMDAFSQKNQHVTESASSPRVASTDSHTGANVPVAPRSKQMQNDNEDAAHPGVVFNKNGQVTLKNILVKIDAPHTDKGVLMMAHYDSRSVSPGAADDGLGLSALLEAMREQSKNMALKNDLYFLFTDAEEQGGIGSKTFVKAHPELKNNISTVINFDARGDRGGLYMFETSDHNYDLVRSYSSVVSSPIAFGFMAELYKHLPNGTDLTNFLQSGYTGLNFAIAEGIEHYHTSSDTFQNVDRGSAYQFMLTAQELSNYAAHNILLSTSNQDGVYFPFWPGNVVVMSKTAAYALSGLAVVLACFWTFLQLRRKNIRFRHIAVGSGWLLGTIIATGLVSWGVVVALTKLLDLKESADTQMIFCIMSIIIGIGGFAVLTLRMRKSTLNEAVAGILPLLAICTIVCIWLLPTASYLFALPMLALMIVTLLEHRNGVRLAASSMLGFSVLLLYVPVCWLVYVMFMLKATPLAIGLGVIPLAIIASCFTTTVGHFKIGNRNTHTRGGADGNGEAQVR